MSDKGAPAIFYGPPQLPDTENNTRTEQELQNLPSPKVIEPVDLRATAFLAKALTDENRLRILLALTAGKKSVSRIVEELGISQPLASHHLKELKRSLLVTVERNGPFIYYELAEQRIVTILAELSDLATGLLKSRTTF